MTKCEYEILGTIDGGRTMCVVFKNPYKDKNKTGGTQYEDVHRNVSVQFEGNTVDEDGTLEIIYQLARGIYTKMTIQQNAVEKNKTLDKGFSAIAEKYGIIEESENENVSEEETIDD